MQNNDKLALAAPFDAFGITVAVGNARPQACGVCLFFERHPLRKAGIDIRGMLRVA